MPTGRDASPGGFSKDGTTARPPRIHVGCDAACGKTSQRRGGCPTPLTPSCVVCDVRGMSHEILADGLQFPEGPVWLGPERVAFTEIRGQCVSVWERGAVRRIARTGGGANGATLGPDGALYVTNNR